MSSPIEYLLERARRNDPAARTALLERYQPLLWRVVGQCRPFSRGSSVEITDLYQQATLAFLELVDQYDPARAVSFGGYLKMLLPLRLKNYLRAQRTRQRGEWNYGVAVPVHLSDHLVTHLASGFDRHGFNDESLGRAFGRLSKKQRWVLGQLYGADRTPNEVAATLGVSPRAVTGLRARALAKLRALLEIPPPPRRRSRRTAAGSAGRPEAERARPEAGWGTLPEDIDAMEAILVRLRAGAPVAAQRVPQTAGEDE